MDSARVAPGDEPDLEEQKEPREKRTVKENFKLEMKTMDAQTKNISHKSVINWIRNTGEKKFGYMLVYFGFLVVIVVCPVILIVIGVENLNNCSIDIDIPIWALVDGAFILFVALSNFFIIGSCINQEDPDKSKILVMIHRILYIVGTVFVLAWHIVGSVWVFQLTNIMLTPNNSSEIYCDLTCYRAAFFTLIVFWLLMVIIIGFIVIHVIRVALRG